MDKILKLFHFFFEPSREPNKEISKPSIDFTPPPPPPPPPRPKSIKKTQPSYYNHQAYNFNDLEWEQDEIDFSHSEWEQSQTETFCTGCVNPSHAVDGCTSDGTPTDGGKTPDGSSGGTSGTVDGASSGGASSADGY